MCPRGGLIDERMANPRTAETVNDGRSLIDIRRLVAVDVAFLGRRLIVAEFGLGVLLLIQLRPSELSRVVTRMDRIRHHLDRGRKRGWSNTACKTG